MHFEAWSFFFGFMIAGMLACLTWIVLLDKRKQQEFSSDDHFLGIAKAMGDANRKLAEAQQQLLEACAKEPAWVGAIIAAVHEHRDCMIGSIAALKSIPIEFSRPKWIEDINDEFIGKHLEPIKTALFRIAADTELSKKRFDVMAHAMGFDGKNDNMRRAEEEPEDSALMFEGMVMEEMKAQGLTWQQAVDSVKARMAHRRRGV